MSSLLDRIGLVAFDLDGTLIDSAPDIAAAANAMLAQLGSGALEVARVRGMIGDGIEALVRSALAVSGTDVSRAGGQAHALRLFREHYSRHIFDQSRLYPGVLEALGELRRRALRLACITNKAQDLTASLLERAGLTQSLEFWLSPSSAEERKPSPRLLQVALQRVGLPPGELLYVGDSRSDLLAARAAGCRIALTTQGYHQGAPLADLGPDALIGPLTDLLLR